VTKVFIICGSEMSVFLTPMFVHLCMTEDSILYIKVKKVVPVLN
jgi:hypothetical protein